MVATDELAASDLIDEIQEWIDDEYSNVNEYNWYHSSRHNQEIKEEDLLNYDNISRK